MKKILSVLLVSMILFSCSNEDNHSQDVSSTIEDLNFTGVWMEKNDKGGQWYGFLVIWKNNEGKYETIYIDTEGDSSIQKEISLKNNRLIVKMVWEGDPDETEIWYEIKMIDQNTICLRDQIIPSPFGDNIMKRMEIVE